MTILNVSKNQETKLFRQHIGYDIMASVSLFLSLSCSFLLGFYLSYTFFNPDRQLSCNPEDLIGAIVEIFELIRDILKSNFFKISRFLINYNSIFYIGFSVCTISVLFLLTRISRISHLERKNSRLHNQKEPKKCDCMSFTVNDVKYSFIFCPNGSFYSKFTKENKEIEEGFWILNVPVTQKMWKSVVGNNPSFFQTNNDAYFFIDRKAHFSDKFREEIDKVDDYPVESVNAYHCGVFIRRFNEILKNGGYFQPEYEWEADLPTLDEWEYACNCGGNSTMRKQNNANYGNPQKRTSKVRKRTLRTPRKESNYGNPKKRTSKVRKRTLRTPRKESNYGNLKKRTSKVGEYPPNDWGLYDMIGNVWEWTKTDDQGGIFDFYNGNPGNLWVCGGSWKSKAQNISVPETTSASYSQKDGIRGFRIVLRKTFQKDTTQNEQTFQDEHNENNGVKEESPPNQ